MGGFRKWGAGALVALLMSACASREPNEQSLKDSFAEQIATAALQSPKTTTPIAPQVAFLINAGPIAGSANFASNATATRT